MTICWYCCFRLAPRLVSLSLQPRLLFSEQCWSISFRLTPAPFAISSRCSRQIDDSYRLVVTEQASPVCSLTESYHCMQTKDLAFVWALPGFFTFAILMAHAATYVNHRGTDPAGFVEATLRSLLHSSVVESRRSPQAQSSGPSSCAAGV